MFDRILVSVDSSPDSEKALDAASELARRFGGDVLVGHVRHIGRGRVGKRGPLPPRGPWLESEQDARELVDAALAVLAGGGAKARGEVLSGNGSVAGQILGAAREHDADLIVLGSRGVSQLEALLLGSVAGKIVHLAPCPVLLVR